DWFHAKTASMPQGRYVKCVDKTVLYDGPLPYDEIPLYLLTEDEEPNAPFGHSKDWDLMGPQQALDSAISTILTNHDALGIQNIILPKGSDLNVEDLGGGLRILEVNMAAGEPKPLQLLQSGENSFRLLDSMVGNMETLSGINSVARG